MSVRALECPADRALFDGTIQGVVAPFYENERPLRGLAGLLDWRLGGVVSECLKRGVLAGRAGECAYVPVQKAGKTYHLLLVGGGTLSRFAKRGLIPDDSFAALRKNLKTLGIQNLAASRADLGGLTDEYLNQQLQGASLWITP
jgi:hypothetical protein